VAWTELSHTLKMKHTLNFSSVNLSTMNLKGSHLGLNLRLQNEKPLPNSLSYGTAPYT